MNKEEIRKFNEKVEYNESISSYIVDILACIIFLPYIVIVVYRRGKYNKRINENEGF